jgi:hypothetical protein
MLKAGKILFLVLAGLCLSCKNDNKYPYAIKDFRRDLQPHLTRIVTNGLVMYGDSALQYMATDQELEQLGRSEHPVLRAMAFREMLQRKSINHYEILMGHLDDTVIVPTVAGEFGIWYRMVSDDILRESEWENQEAKNKTIEQVMTQHNYLHSAAIIIPELDVNERFYPFIKTMAARPRKDNPFFPEVEFQDIEYALYGLARFRKKEDVALIKKRLMSNLYNLRDVSFVLMKEYPDTAYLDVFQAYFPLAFHDFNCKSRFETPTTEYIESLAVYQNERSAEIMEKILQQLPHLQCRPNSGNYEQMLIQSIWEHPCPAYSRLREKIKSKAETYSRQTFKMEIGDTVPDKIRWYQGRL